LGKLPTNSPRIDLPVSLPILAAVLEGIDIPSRRQLDRLMAIEGEAVVSVYFANEIRGDSDRTRGALERAIAEATRAVRVPDQKRGRERED
jgi:hypothetical protein